MLTTQSECYQMGDPRQTAVSDLSRVILCLVVLRFEHSTLWVYVEQLNHSAISAQMMVIRHVFFGSTE
jgi:hypothetical protein